MSTGRLIGLDIGETRIGVAVSDSLGLLAHPYEVLVGYDPDRLADHIVRLLAELGGARVVVGLPITRSGDEGEQAGIVRRFLEPLRGRGVEVVFRDERLSTVEANRRLAEAAGGRMRRRRRARLDDAAAAALILQGYLESEMSSGHAPEESA